ncbi:MAG: (d)CMP kinase [Dongiaceae bacterium]
MKNPSPPIIAVDGPAASGKGTLAKRLAAHFDYAYLDTGLIYRAVAAAILKAGLDPHDAAMSEKIAKTITWQDLSSPDLRTEEVSQATSISSLHPGLRAAVLQMQRDFASRPPKAKKGAVLDGRDIGTVVCPDAQIKLFITASPEIRAARRVKELQNKGIPAIETQVLADLQQRDRRDSTRAVAPLKPAPDAYILDTSSLDAEEAFQAALAYINSRTAGKLS